MKHLLRNSAIGFFVILVLLAAGRLAAAQTVQVANVEELYSAVNDPANTGATVVILPGVYTLSAKDADGIPRPNGGRLELRTDMSLFGSVGDRSAVVIDAASLPNASFLIGTVRTGAIRIGAGTNSVEWLTIVGNSFSAGGIETDLPGPSANVRIAHIASSGSIRGIDVRSQGASSSGRTIDAEIVDSELHNANEGFRVVNFGGVIGGVITVRMSGNRVHNNLNGCVIENASSSFSSISVRSAGDRFEDNGAGCVIGGALIGGAVGTANSNITNFEAYGCSVVNNTGPFGIDRGGLIVFAAETPNIAFAASDNTLNILLRGCIVSGNQNSNIEAYGARGIVSQPGKFSGINNRTTIRLSGVTKFVDNVIEFDSLPAEPAGTNELTIIR